jgi:hypothetical protein
MRIYKYFRRKDMTEKMTKKIIFLALGMLFIISGCYVVPAPQPTAAPPAGEWVPVTIRATGGGAPPARAANPAQARLMAERAAKMDAYRNLLEQAYGVNIRSNTTVRNFATQNDVIRSRVEAYIRGAKVLDTRHLEDGGVEVEMEVTLGYDFRRIFP